MMVESRNFLPRFRSTGQWRMSQPRSPRISPSVESLPEEEEEAEAEEEPEDQAWIVLRPVAVGWAEEA